MERVVKTRLFSFFENFLIFFQKTIDNQKKTMYNEVTKVQKGTPKTKK